MLNLSTMYLAILNCELIAIFYIQALNFQVLLPTQLCQLYYCTSLLLADLAFMLFFFPSLCILDENGGI